MRVIKICFDCYIDCEILIEEGDIIIITNEEECEHK
jgi:hypothetical protein